MTQRMNPVSLLIALLLFLAPLLLIRRLGEQMVPRDLSVVRTGAVRNEIIRAVGQVVDTFLFRQGRRIIRCSVEYGAGNVATTVVGSGPGWRKHR
jgi:hypothetical protein